MRAHAPQGVNALLQREEWSLDPRQSRTFSAGYRGNALLCAISRNPSVIRSWQMLLKLRIYSLSRFSPSPSASAAPQQLPCALSHLASDKPITRETTPERPVADGLCPWVAPVGNCDFLAMVNWSGAFPVTASSGRTTPWLHPEFAYASEMTSMMEQRTKTRRTPMCRVRMPERRRPAICEAKTIDMKLSRRGP